MSVLFCLLVKVFLVLFRPAKSVYSKATILPGILRVSNMVETCSPAALGLTHQAVGMGKTLPSPERILNHRQHACHSEETVQVSRTVILLHNPPAYSTRSMG